MKLHLCCGTVYLENYLNVDVQGYIRGENLEVQINETSFKNYYKFPLRNEPLTQRGNFVIDQRVNILIPFPWYQESIDEVVMIQSLEHFLPFEVEFIIGEIHRILKPEGFFIFDFPDIVKTVEIYGKKDFKKMNRLIYCNHKDKYSIHKSAYNEELFKQTLLENDRRWNSIEFKEVVEHEYPVIGGRAIK